MASPCRLIALFDGDGRKVSSFNQSSIAKDDFYRRKIVSYLNSDISAPGTYTIRGTLSTNAGEKTHAVPILQIEKNSFEKAPIILPTPPIKEVYQDKRLIEENAELRYKVKFLEEETNRLKELIEEMESDFAELEEAPAIPAAKTAMELLAEQIMPLVGPLTAHLVNKYVLNETQNPAQGLAENGKL